MNKKSELLFQKARKYIPGGVNSPVRAGKAVGIDPPFIAEATGCLITDVDGNEYIDYICSWGPMILGHTHPDIIRAIKESIKRGTSFGAPTGVEVQMAETIVDMVPSIEMVRMVNSGTEATMSAIRLARGFTVRDKIIKFDGCYHGHADSLLVSAGSGVATLGIPGSPGVPGDLAKLTISLPFNNLESVVRAFHRFGSDIAAVIVEPVPANMGVIIPDMDFLNGLRKITDEYGSILIFDEVISGFRLAHGGAQELFDIMPDLTCLGKIIGGGLPVGAYGGKKEIMSRMAPEGDVYQAGTLSGNPVAMAAGLATLNILKQGNIYEELEKKGRVLFSGIEEAANQAGVQVTVNRVGSLGSIFFHDQPVTDFHSANATNADIFSVYFKSMLEQGIYLAPSPYEAVFLSTAHTEDIIKKTIKCAKTAFSAI
ncbi:MAG: glutamate-1-semialdehyde 2,1-aminomutase [Deltaproteobacteria bacterium]|nr:glutamate-1-semialdehyde 2,1-aminomutase [Deltaproteobacteria bacterium]